MGKSFVLMVFIILPNFAVCYRLVVKASSSEKVGLICPNPYAISQSIQLRPSLVSHFGDESVSVSREVALNNTLYLDSCGQILNLACTPLILLNPNSLGCSALRWWGFVSFIVSPFRRQNMLGFPLKVKLGNYRQPKDVVSGYRASLACFKLITCLLIEGVTL